MTRFLVRRGLQALVTIFLAATLVFALIHLIPGDPVELMLGDGARAADVEALRSRLGLDRSLSVQYADFVAGLAHGDLGRSIHYGEPVTHVLARRFPATVELAAAALAVALLVALPLGTAAALRRGRGVDHGARVVSLVGVSLPNFWLGPMLILLAAIQWRLFPVSGREEPLAVVLPAVTLGTGLAGLLTRMVRTSLVDELEKPYLVTARAKGLSRFAAVVRHAFKNALIPVITIVGLQFGTLLTGAIITETIFAWPGLGRLLIESIRLRDYPVLQGAVLVIAVTYVVVNLVTDIAYAALDPRIRYS